VPAFSAVLGVIPYKTFPIINLGPLELRTFGLMVGLGVLIGAWVAARYIEAHCNIGRDETYRLATRLVVAGVIGARITWDITHWSDLGSPLDLIAVWKGGLQFSGGFVAAVLVSVPTFRKWSRQVRWSTIDGYGLGLTIGLAFGRVGCTSVGEHFGGESSWLLAMRYEGGSVREPTLGGADHPLIKGATTFHNTAIYELLFLLVLFGILLLLARRRPAPSTLIGVFCVYYGVARGLSDFLRVNDETVLGLTGAQWLCVVLIPAGIYILTKIRPSLAASEAHIEPEATESVADGANTE
jgi:phosphatidylglycerol:prolipoprotein diacylglycerol transferase